MNYRVEQSEKLRAQSQKQQQGVQKARARISQSMKKTNNNGISNTIKKKAFPEFLSTFVNHITVTIKSANQNLEHTRY